MRYMPKGKTGDDWNLKKRQTFFEDIIERLSVFFSGVSLGIFAPAVDSNSHPGDLLQNFSV
jgi:hypothetical protein